MSTTHSSGPAPIDLQALLAEFDSSGQSAAAFSRTKGLPPWKLYGALQRRSGKVRPRRRAARGERTALLPVHVVDARPGRPPAPLELLVAGGHRVLIGPDFDALTLRRLIEALSPC